jgi:hypothetical protein
MLRLILCTLTLLGSTQMRAERCTLVRQSAASLPYAAGEELSYRMEVKGMAAGRAHLKIGALERTPFGVGYPIRADVETNAYAAFATDLAGRFLSVMDPRSQESRYYRSSLNQVDGVIHDRAVLNGGVIRFEHAKGNRRKEGALSGAFIDPIQLLYGMRDVPLVAGHQICLRMYAYSGLNRLKGRVVVHEEIQTAAGPVDAWRLELELQRGKRRYPVRLWVGADGTRPVWRAELSHPQGKLTVHLDRHILGKGMIYRL